ncbi:NAD-dependent epimerase/dehydratase family protein, partial [Patescibacteria group bacterium]|nr:NAD-dependent epimerase/dehydratase family protein [Patescibacteria group bacterium]
MIKPKILITGITGFVGLHLLEEIKKKKLEQQYDFRVLLRKPIILPNFIQIFKGDLRNLNVLHSALEESNIIIHLASILDSSNKNLQHVNIKSSANIINTMKQDSKIIFLSSITVNYQDKTKYSNSKLVVENLIKKTCKHYTIIRPSWIYGNNSRSFEKLLSLIKQSLFIPIIKNK